MRTWVCIVAAAIGAASASPQVWRGPLTRTDCVGNGGLTLGMSARGVVEVCRWPSPGSADQLGQHNEPAGLQWGLQRGGKVRWTGACQEDDCLWTTDNSKTPGLLSSHCTGATEGIELSQEVFVAPTEDAAVFRIEAAGLGGESRLVWSADFSPAGGVVPGLPGTGTAWDALTDCAVYLPDSQTAVHFRPESYGQAGARALRALHAGDPGPGVYIACRPIVGRGMAQCGEWRQTVGEGAWRGPESASEAAGQVYSRFVFEEGFPKAAMAVAFGATLETALRTLDEACEAGLPALRNRTVRHWKAFLERPTRDVPPQYLPMLRHSCLRLCWLTDKRTGAAVRRQSSNPRDMLAWPEDAYWGVRAWVAAGFTEHAEQICRFWAGCRRKQSQPGAPVGAVPLAVYTDGSSGPPPWLTSIEPACCAAAAWGAYAEALPPELQQAFAGAMAAAIQDVRAFLSQWRDPRTGRPAPSFRLGLLRDAAYPVDAARVDAALAVLDAIEGEGAGTGQDAAGGPSHNALDAYDGGSHDRLRAVQRALVEPASLTEQWDALAGALAIHRNGADVPSPAAELARKLFMDKPPALGLPVKAHAQVVFCAGMLAGGPRIAGPLN